MRKTTKKVEKSLYIAIFESLSGTFFENPNPKVTQPQVAPSILSLM